MVGINKQKLSVSINPLYRCNLNCPFCYLGDLKDNQNTLDLTYLVDTLNNLSIRNEIVAIDIYGGEISLLSDFYFDFLVRLSRTFCKEVNVTTNFTTFHRHLINNFENIGVSLDFNDYRGNQNQVYNNIKAAVDSGKVINVLSLDISCQNNKEQIVDKLNELGIQSWRLIPYSKSRQTRISFKGYDFFENTIKEFLKLKHKMKFSFINSLQLDGIINIDNYNVEHVYITPNNKVALLKFIDNEEYFEEYDSLDQLYDEIKKEQAKKDKYCEKCLVKNQCLAEHYNYGYTGKSCSGYRDLIMSYKNDN